MSSPESSGTLLGRLPLNCQASAGRHNVNNTHNEETLIRIENKSQIFKSLELQYLYDTQTSWALSIQPKSPEISVDSSNGTDHFGLVRPEYSGPALKVVHCDRSGHFGRSDRNVPFHLPKLLSPVPLFSILLTRQGSFHWKVKCCE